jgi:hypothetical protein
MTGTVIYLEIVGERLRGGNWTGFLKVVFTESSPPLLLTVQILAHSTSLASICNIRSRPSGLQSYLVFLPFLFQFSMTESKKRKATDSGGQKKSKKAKKEGKSASPDPDDLFDDSGADSEKAKKDWTALPSDEETAELKKLFDNPKLTTAEWFANRDKFDSATKQKYRQHYMFHAGMGSPDSKALDAGFNPQAMKFLIADDFDHFEKLESDDERHRRDAEKVLEPYRDATAQDKKKFKALSTEEKMDYRQFYMNTSRDLVWGVDFALQDDSFQYGNGREFDPVLLHLLMEEDQARLDKIDQPKVQSAGKVKPSPKSAPKKEDPEESFKRPGFLVARRGTSTT